MDMEPIGTAPTDGTHIQGFDRLRFALGEVYHAFKPGTEPSPWRTLSGNATAEPAFWLPSMAGPR